MLHLINNLKSKNPLTPDDERLQWLMEAVPNGILVVDQTGSITMSNSLVAKQFGYEEGELLGKPVEILLPPALRGSHPGKRDGFFADPQARAMGSGRHLFALRKDGSEFPVEIGLNPIEVD